MIVIGGMFETLWATTMYLSECFTIWYWTVPTFGIMFISVWFLERGMGANIPTGVAYSVWVGMGAVGTVAVGIFLFSEPVTLERMFFVFLIIFGIIGLEMSTKHKKKASA
ncbi:MAG: DMT family transporter [Candidatus Methanomethylophilaceae archaeon]|jgi:quaternary ammonium compound-resistance protein SugE